MRLILLTIAILVITPSLLLRPAQTQEQEKPPPDPAKYAPADENCKNKVRLSPWVGTPVGRCLLDIHTCEGVEKFGLARETGDCDDFRRVADALATREICCPCKEQNTPPWFDTGACDEPMRGPDPSVIATPSTGGVICTITYSVCSLGAFEKREKYFSTGLLNFRIMNTKEAEKFCASKGYGRETVPLRAVCCKKWRQSVADWIAFRKRHGPPESRPPGVPPGRVEPCSPSIDADCDGIYNLRDPTPLGDCASYPAAPSQSP